jgi:Immunoglobulin I-set domain
MPCRANLGANFYFAGFTLLNFHVIVFTLGFVLDRRSTSIKMMNNGEAEEHILTIDKVRVFDGGKYTCLASNEVGVAEKSYRIKVLGINRFH